LVLFVVDCFELANLADPLVDVQVSELKSDKEVNSLRRVGRQNGTSVLVCKLLWSFAVSPTRPNTLERNGSGRCFYTR
jgi:hypothetical protein